MSSVWGAAGELLERQLWDLVACRDLWPPVYGSSVIGALRALPRRASDAGAAHKQSPSAPTWARAANAAHKQTISTSPLCLSAPSLCSYPSLGPPRSTPSSRPAQMWTDGAPVPECAGRREESAEERCVAVVWCGGAARSVITRGSGDGRVSGPDEWGHLTG